MFSLCQLLTFMVMPKIKDEHYFKMASTVDNWDIDKLEKSQKAEMRMISPSAYRCKSKCMRIEDSSRYFGKTDAGNVRMYETHIPGFCYTRSGEYRQLATSSLTSINKDKFLCSEKVKALLFTDDELDIEKVMCLHLLSTHVHNRNYIQRKDGRVCSFVKSTLGASKRHTLEIKSVFHGDEKYFTYYKVLPKYVLDIQTTDSAKSGSSIRTSDYETGSDDDRRASNRKLKVPIFINNEIKVIVNSVIEALESVNSPKLEELINLAQSPEELRNMLQRDSILEYMFEIISHPMILRATAYDYVFTHPMFDKIPDTGTMETVAQVLEIDDDDGLHMLLGLVRKTIGKRYVEVTRSGSAGRKKSRIQEIKSASRSSFSSNEVLKSLDSRKSSVGLRPKDTIFVHKCDSGKESSKKTSESCSEPRASINFSLDDILKTVDLEEFRRRFFSKTEEQDFIKYDLRRLSNSQRILVGLKVAGLRSKNGNTYPFEARRKLDMPAIIKTSISDDRDDVMEALTNRFGGPKRISDPHPLLSKRSSAQVFEFLEGLTRSMLADLRQEIAVRENKKKITEFLSKLY